MLTPAAHLRYLTAKESAGVGRSDSNRYVFTLLPQSTSAAVSAKSFELFLLS